ncbi:histidine kinase [Fictibacillus enclensis]|uniref:sensor histidine kinase n=1 Tax=Fictibacillus enclensis TaxID=1017270 RepID=UPI0025A28471|nr:histidine kinase [Fictibacillus enclensis]MDM5339149.1 histidine kinase [Fictibacillus enclensis]
MTYKQIKWLILMLPTLSIGAWEYLRHTLLMPYMSMEMGNFLSPLIVFGVTVIFVVKLFNRLEKIQSELNEERSQKTALQERAKMARELHDGMAQSLFLLSIKINKLGRQANLAHNPHFIKMKQTLHHIHEDTRQAINNLRSPLVETNFNWTEALLKYISEVEKEHQLQVTLNWKIDESLLSTKEKVELFACIKETLINAIKHASSKQVWMMAEEHPEGWLLTIRNQTERTSLPEASQGYGLQILKDRAAAMSCLLDVSIEHGEMCVSFCKGVLKNGRANSSAAGG